MASNCSAPLYTSTVAQSATEFFNSLRTATVEELEDIRRTISESLNTEEENDDLLDKHIIAEDLLRFKTEAWWDDTLYTGTIPSVQGIIGREYLRNGLAGTCSEEHAREIAQSIFYPNPAPRSGSIHLSAWSDEGSESVKAEYNHTLEYKRSAVAGSGRGCGLRPMLRTLLTKLRSGREASSAHS